MKLADIERLKECLSELTDTTIYKYEKEVNKTRNNKLNEFESLLEGLMGLNGEAGEAIDILKKQMFQDHKEDYKHIASELGDCCWYITVTANAMGYSLVDILNMNIEKLHKRYPNGFDSAKSIDRSEDDI